MDLPVISKSIQFLSAQGGGGEGGTTPVVQTGDSLIILMAILAFCAAALFGATCLWARAKKARVSAGAVSGTNTKQTTKYSFLQKFSLVAVIVSIAFFALLSITNAPVFNAFAGNNDVVLAYVDENTGEVTIDESTLVNNCSTKGDIYIAESTLRVNDEAKAVSGINDVVLQANCMDGVLFEGKAKSTYKPSKDLILTYEQEEALKLAISNISADTAKSLIDKTAFTLEFTPKNITRIQYQANGATWGTAPETQYIEWTSGKAPAVTISQNVGDLSKDGLYFDGWNTKADGTGTNYVYGQTIEEGDLLHGLTLYADWKATPTNVVVAFNSTYGHFSDGTRIRNITQKVGLNYVLPEEEPVLDNKSFAGWWTTIDSTGQRIDDQTLVSDYMPHTIFAHWNDITLDVTFDANGGQVEGKDKVTISEIIGNTYSFPSTPVKANKVFAGWWTQSQGGKQITPETLVSVDADKSLYAHWEDQVITVTFNANGGQFTGGSTTDTRTEVVGSTYTLPDKEPTYEFKEFAGWWTDPLAGTEVKTSTPVTASDPIILYAHWNNITLTCTFDANGGSFPVLNSVTQQDIPQVHGNQYVFPTPDPRKVYKEFAGWFTDPVEGIQVKYGEIVQKTENHTLYAHWNDINVVATFSANGGSFNDGTTAKNQDELLGGKYILPETEPTRSGFIFDGWWTDSAIGNQITEDTTVTNANAHTIYAHWKERTITVTFNPDGGKFPDEQTDPKPIDEIVNGFYIFPEQPTKGYLRFAGWWTTDATPQQIIPGVSKVPDVEEGFEVIAHWEEVPTFDVVFNSVEGTWESGKQQTKTQALGNKYNLPENPERYGYTFNGWFTAITGGQQITSETTVADTTINTLYAQWTAKTFNLTFDANGGKWPDGTTTPKVLSQTFGEAYNTPASPTYEGATATFEGWYTKNSNGEKIRSKVDTLEYSVVYANYVGAACTVTYDACNGETTHQTSQEHFLSVYQMKNVEDPVKPGYTFLGWYSSDGYLIKAGETVCLGYYDFTLYAHWQPIQFNIVFDAQQGTFGSQTRVEVTQTVGEPYRFPSDIKRTGYTAYKWFDWEGNEIVPGTIVTDPEITYIYLTWTPVTVKVKFEANDGAWTSGEAPIISETYDTEYVLPNFEENPLVREGYEFVNWNTAAAGSGISVNPGDICKISSAQSETVSLFAQWVPRKISVTYDAGEGGWGRRHQETVTDLGFHETYVFPDLGNPERTGYDFKGWYLNNAFTGDKLVEDTTIINTDQDHTVYAKWEIKKVPVTYIWNDTMSGTNTHKTIEVEYGTAYPTSEPTPESPIVGWTWDKWYTDAECTSPLDEGTILEKETAHNVYGKWNPITVKAIFHSNYGTDLRIDVNQTFDSPIVFPTYEFSRDGYSHNNLWYENKECTGNPIDNNSVWKFLGTGERPVKDLYLQWTPNQIPVTYVSDGTPLIQSKEETFDSPYRANVTTPTKTGYTFNGWYDNPECSGDPITPGETKVENPESHILYAGWTPVSCEITLNADGGDQPGITSIWEVYNTEYRATATGAKLESITPPTKENYNFEGYYTTDGTQVIDSEGNITGSTTLFDNPEASYSIKAKWSAKTCTVSFDVNGGKWPSGDVQPINITETYNTKYIVPSTVPTLDHNRFIGWFTESTGGSQILDNTLVPNSNNHILYAHYIEVSSLEHSYQYIFRTEISEGVYQAVALPIFDVAQEGHSVHVDYPDLSASGYTLKDQSKTYDEFTMGDKDRDVVNVEYVENEATLTYQATEGGSIEGEAAETVKAVTGNPAGVTAVADDQYKFVKWQIKTGTDTWQDYQFGATIVPTRNNNNIYEDSVFRAVFAKDSATVHFMSSDNDLGSISFTIGGSAIMSLEYGTKFKVNETYKNQLDFYSPDVDPSVGPVLFSATATGKNNYVKFEQWDCDTSGTITEALTVFQANFSTLTTTINPQTRNDKKGVVNSSSLNDIPLGSTYTVNESGTLSITNAITESVTVVTISPANGYHYDKWAKDKDGKETLVAGTVYTIDNTTNLDLYAFFTIDIITITFEAGDHGTMPTDPQPIYPARYGSHYEIEKTAEGIYTGKITFDYWTDPDEGQSEHKFEPINFKGIPETGYEFLKYDKSDSGDILGSENTTWETQYKLISYTISAEAQKIEGKDVGSVTVSDTDTLNHFTQYQVFEDNVIKFSNDFSTDNGTLKSITPTAKTGYHFVKWLINGEEAEWGTDPKIVEGNIVFTAVFEENEEVTITYMVNPDFFEGDYEAGAPVHTGLIEPEDKSIGTVSTYFTESYKPVTGGFQGAKVFEDQTWAGDPDADNHFKYYYLNWTIGQLNEDGTIEDTGVEAPGSPKPEDHETTAFVPQRVDGVYQSAIYIAHFNTAVAIYDKNHETLTFDYIEKYYKDKTAGIKIDNTYPVYEDTDIEFDEHSRPQYIRAQSWYNYQELGGLSLPVPTIDFKTVTILPDFKKFTKVTSTAVWFASVGNSGIPQGYLPSRHLEEINGLENIYTENITKTTGMFASMNAGIYEQGKNDDSSPKVIDLSQWNTPKLTDAFAMFMGCTDTEQIILPPSPTSNAQPQFGQAITNANSMFSQCWSLTDLTINGSFGTEITDICYMFRDCYNLEKININNPDFGGKAVDFEGLCTDDYSLKSFKLEDTKIGTCALDPEKPDQKHNYRYMFCKCEKLSSLDFSKLIVDENADITDMLFNCNMLSQFTIGPNWSQSKNFSGTTIDPDNILVWYIQGEANLTDQIPAKSGAGTYSRLMPKAVYDEATESLTFYFDYEVHNGTEVFAINPSTGIRQTLVFPDWYDVKVYRDGELFTPEVESPESRLSEDNGPLSATIASNFIQNFLNYDISLDLKVKVPKAKKVKFDSSFANYTDLQSMAFWFVGDSYGNQPFEEFEGFGNINTSNMGNQENSVLCMFGGVDLGLLYEVAISMVNTELGYGYASQKNVHCNDTYGTSHMHTKGSDALDISAFDTYSDESLEIRHNLTDYAGMFANATGVTNIILPRRLGGWDIGEGQRADEHFYNSSRFTYSYMFENCSSLTSIQNLDLVNNETGNLSYCVNMFAGCSNLEKADLRNMYIRNTNDIGYYDNKSYGGFSNMFTGCNRLASITVGDGWAGKKVDSGDSKNYNFVNIGVQDTSTSGNAWHRLVHQKGGVTNTENIQSFENVPIYQEPDYAGLYTIERDASKINRQEINFTVNNPEYGTVVPSDPIDFTGSFNYSCKQDGTLLINDKKVVAQPSGGENKFKFWVVNGNKVDPSNVFSDRQVCYSDAPVVEIQAIFGEAGNIPKAVYNQTNETLTFYYDKESHASEGVVYPVYNGINEFGVNESTGWTCERNSYGDWTSVMKLPAWYDIEARDNAREEDAPAEKLSGESNAHIPTSQQIVCDPKESKIKLLINAKTVIFDSTFKNFDELQSIGCWFMADSFGKECFSEFKSRMEDGVTYHDGFENLSTTCLQNVSYAFGGILSSDYKSYFNSGGKDILKSIFSLFDNAIDSASSSDFANEYDTYNTSLKKIDLSSLDLSNLKDCSHMFTNCLALEQVIFGSGKTPNNVTNMQSMFANCESLGVNENIDPIVGLNSFNTSHVTNFSRMFYGCSRLKSLDLSNFDTTHNLDIEDYYSANPSTWAYQMFTDCVRLGEITINSEFDPNQPFGLKGWTLNFGASGFVVQDDSGEKEQPIYWDMPYARPPLEDISSFDIPFEQNSRPVDTNDYYSGTFTRDIPDDKYVYITVDDPSHGTINGETQVDYSYQNTAQIKVQLDNSKIIWTDNLKKVVEAKEGWRFVGWTLKETPESEPVSLPYNYNETFDASYDGLTIIANFIEDDGNDAKAVYSVVTDTETDVKTGKLTFVYDDIDYLDGGEHKNIDGEIKDCWVVPAVANDYNWVPWYESRSIPSPDASDDHEKPFYKSVITNPDEGTIIDSVDIEFKESFHDFSYLQSLSCWFMPAYIGDNDANPTAIFNVDTMKGLEYINTGQIINVEGMFGGIEANTPNRNDETLPNSYYEKITLSGFDTGIGEEPEHKLKNIDGLFANCFGLKEIDFGTGAKKFSTTNITSMRRLFFNCDNLVCLLQTEDVDKIRGFYNVLSNLDTSNTKDMSYIFAKHVVQSIIIETNPEALTVMIVFPNQFNTNNVETLDYMFSGLPAASINLLSLSSFPDPWDPEHLDPGTGFDTSNAVSAVGMFKDSYVARINTPAAYSNFTTKNVKNMSYMFAGNMHINTTAWIIDAIDLSSVENMSYMFFGCSHLSEFKLNFVASNTNIKDARFMCCDSRKSINRRTGEVSLRAARLESLSSFDITNMNLNIQNFGTYNVDELGGERWEMHTYSFMLFAWDYTINNFTIDNNWSVKLENCGISHENDTEYFSDNSKDPLDKYTIEDIPVDDFGQKHYGTFSWNEPSIIPVQINRQDWGTPYFQSDPSGQPVFYYYGYVTATYHQSTNSVTLKSHMTKDPNKYIQKTDTLMLNPTAALNANVQTIEIMLPGFDNPVTLEDETPVTSEISGEPGAVSRMRVAYDGDVNLATYDKDSGTLNFTYGPHQDVYPEDTWEIDPLQDPYSPENPAPWMQTRAADISQITFSDSFKFNIMRNFNYWFAGLYNPNLKSLDLTGLNVANGTLFESMFENSKYLQSVKFFNEDSQSLREASNFINMFKGCEALESVDFTGFVTRERGDADNMFAACPHLYKLDFGEKWQISFYNSGLSEDTPWVSDRGKTCNLDMLGETAGTYLISDSSKTIQIASDYGQIEGITEIHLPKEVSANDGFYAKYSTNKQGYINIEVGGPKGSTSYGIADFVPDYNNDPKYDWKSWNMNGKELDPDLEPQDIEGQCTFTAISQEASSEGEFREGMAYLVDTPTGDYTLYFEYGERAKLPSLHEKVISTFPIRRTDKADYWNWDGDECPFIYEMKADDLAKVTKVVFGDSFSQTIKLKSMKKWFENFHRLETVEGINNVMTTRVNNLAYCFHNCEKLQSINLTAWDTRNVENLSYMFALETTYDNISLENVNLNGWDTSKVGDFSHMFENRSHMKECDVSTFTTKDDNCDLQYMFWNCGSLDSIDVSGFNVTQNTKYDGFLQYGFKKYTIGDNMHINLAKICRVDTPTLYERKSDGTTWKFNLISSDTTGAGTYSALNRIYVTSANSDTLFISANNDMDNGNFVQGGNRHLFAKVDVNNKLHVIATNGPEPIDPIDEIVFTPTVDKKYHSDAEFYAWICDDNHTLAPDMDWYDLSNSTWVYAHPDYTHMRAVYDKANNTAIFYYGKMSNPQFSVFSDKYCFPDYEESGPEYSLWSRRWTTASGEPVKTIKIDESVEGYAPTSMNHWFQDCSNLEVIEGLEHINTKNISSMVCAFDGCTKLKKIEFSNKWGNDVNYINTEVMFRSCDNLESVSLGSLRITSYPTMYGTFIPSTKIKKFSFKYPISPVDNLLPLDYYISNNCMWLSETSPDQVLTSKQIFGQIGDGRIYNTTIYNVNTDSKDLKRLEVLKGDDTIKDIEGWNIGYQPFIPNFLDVDVSLNKLDNTKLDITVHWSEYFDEDLLRDKGYKKVYTVTPHYVTDRYQFDRWELNKKVVLEPGKVYNLKDYDAYKETSYRLDCYAKDL